MTDTQTIDADATDPGRAMVFVADGDPAQRGGHAEAICFEGGSAAKTGMVKSRKNHLSSDRLARALGAISSVNKALVSAVDELELANEVCRILVREGGYLLAWVGYAQHDKKKTVRPVAQEGYDEDYLDTIDISWANVKRGRGPVGTAIRSSLPVVIKNLLTDPDFEPWRDEAIKRRYQSAIALPLTDRKEVIGAIIVYAEVPNAFDSDEIELLVEMASDLGYGIGAIRTLRGCELAESSLEESNERLRKSLLATVEALARTFEIRDPYTAGHQSRVASLSVAIARELEVPNEEVEGIRLAALIHDIGKIYVPIEILVKPGRLTKVEYEMVQTHAQHGYDIVKDLDFPWPVADMIGQHHERIDGSGYPNGLSGNSVCIGARIIAVADTVESMATNRPYRPAVGLAEALLEILNGKDKIFDGDVVDACVNVIREKRFVFS